MRSPIPSCTLSRLCHPALAVLTTLACTPGTAGEAANLLVRDSAGVEIVTLPAFESGAYGVLQLDSPARFEVGSGTDGSPVLERTTSALLLDDGGLAVLDAAAATVHRYGPSGTFLGLTGRRGDGPGEFRWPGFLRRWGTGSLAIWDGTHDRLTLLDERAEWHGDSAHPEIGVATVYSRAGDDSMFISRLDRPASPPGNGMHAFGIVLALVAAAGEDTLFQFEGPRWFFEWRGPLDLQIMPVPFEPEPVLVPLGNRIMLATGRSPDLAVYDASGTLTTRVTLPDLRRPVEPAEVDIIVANQLELERGPARETAREVYGRLPIPGRHPAHGTVLTGRDGSIWIQDPPDPRRDSVTWTVLSPGYRKAARITLPLAWTLHDVGLDAIVAGYLEDDEPRVSVFRLHMAS